MLVIEGIQDERIPLEYARQFIAEAGEQVTYVELDTDHFLIMKQPRAVQDELNAWLVERELGN